MGQASLIDDAQLSGVAVEPDRPIVLASNPHARSIAFEFAERRDFAPEGFESLNAAEIGKGDHECAFDDFGACFAQELDRSLGRPSGRDEIIDQQHPLAGFDRVDVHLDTIESVLELEITPDRLGGEFARLTDWDEAEAQSIRDGCPENEASRLDPDDHVQIARPMPVRDAIDSQAQALRVT
jgi:hypothetical protein